MKVLIIGSGGREHAILWALKRNSGGDLDLYCAPGNAGISELARCVPIDALDIAGLVEFAMAEAIDLTFVGPEGPLAAGIVDRFAERGLLIAGPSMAASSFGGYYRTPVSLCTTSSPPPTPGIERGPERLRVSLA